MTVNVNTSSDNNTETAIENRKKEILKNMIKFTIQNEKFNVDDTILLQKFYDWLVKEPSKIDMIDKGNINKLAEFESKKSTTGLNDEENETYKKLLELTAKHIYQLMLIFLQKIKEAEKQKKELDKPKTATRFKIRSVDPKLVTNR